VCGLGNVGYRVVEELLREGERVVVLERSATNTFISTARRQGAAVVVGDATVPEVLRQVNAANARAVVAATSNELANLEIVLLVRQLHPSVRVVLRLRDPGLAETIRQGANIQLALSVPELAAPAFVAALYGDRVRGVFFVQGRLLAVVDLMPQAGDGLLDGQSVRVLAVDYGALPVALRGADQVTHSQPLNTRLHPGDCLTVIVGLPDLQRLLQREPAPRGWEVEVTAVPVPARPFVAQLLRTRDGLDAETAEKQAQQLPLMLGKGLTRGQAEDLLYLLTRERVGAQVRRQEEK
jgi:Trk K+ transport system NAD-binding subunit